MTRLAARNDETRMANVKGMTKQSVIRYIVTSIQRTYGSTTQRFNDLTWRSRSSLSARGAFTLIELIVVVTVIVILTGLVLSTVGYVQKKAARSRAETEIAAMSAAWKATRRTMVFTRKTATQTPWTQQPMSILLRLPCNPRARRTYTAKRAYIFMSNCLA